LAATSGERSACRAPRSGSKNQCPVLRERCYTGVVGTWTKSELPVGQALRKPAPLFRKLDENVVAEEYARLEG
jgi:hypothetical protein